MKKILLLITFFLLIIGCSSSDEDINQDLPIVGTWILLSDIEDGKEVAGICEKQSTLIVSNDLTIQATFFNTDLNNNCSSSFDNGNLEQLSNSVYFFPSGNPNEQFRVSGDELRIIYLDDDDTYMIFKRN